MQVVVEFEGVIVEDTSDVHSKAWVQLAEDEGRSRPLQFALKRAEGMKNDQVQRLLQFTCFLISWCHITDI